MGLKPRLPRPKSVVSYILNSTFSILHCSSSLTPVNYSLNINIFSTKIKGKFWIVKFFGSFAFIVKVI